MTVLRAGKEGRIRAVREKKGRKKRDARFCVLYDIFKHGK
jgi:hypothetical protein